MGVPAGNGEIDLGRPDAGPDSCVSGQLPARAQLDVAICRLQHDRLGQPPRGGCEPDQRWQRNIALSRSACLRAAKTCPRTAEKHSCDNSPVLNRS
jgi:hypothetical protein